MISDRTYDFALLLKEPKARLDKDQDKDKSLNWKRKKQSLPVKKEAEDDNGKKRLNFDR